MIGGRYAFAIGCNHSDRVKINEAKPTKGRDHGMNEIDQKPFLELKEPRSVDCKDLPADLRKFYSRYEGCGRESSPERLVRLCKLSEVKPITWKDLHIFGADPPPDGWETFSGYRLGISVYFDDIIYVQSTPVCKPGSVFTIGVDVAGPGGEGPHALENSVVLASSFDAWIEHLEKTNWVEYGLGPGSRFDLPAEEHRSLIEYFKALNPRSFWRDAKPGP